MGHRKTFLIGKNASESSKLMRGHAFVDPRWVTRAVAGTPLCWLNLGDPTHPVRIVRGYPPRTLVATPDITTEFTPNPIRYKVQGPISNSPSQTYKGSYLPRPLTKHTFLRTFSPVSCFRRSLVCAFGPLERIRGSSPSPYLLAFRVTSIPTNGSGGGWSVVPVTQTVGIRRIQRATIRYV